MSVSGRVCLVVLAAGVSLAGVSCGKRGAATSPAAGAAAALEGGKAAPAMPGVNVEAIKVNTVGYPVGWRKLAILNSEPSEVRVETADGARVALEVASNRIVSKGIDEASQDSVWQVDFTELEAPGRYRLINGPHRSVPFEIKEGVYQKALVLAQKQFYFQRTRTVLVSPFADFEGTFYRRPEPSHVHEDVGWDLLDYPEKKRKWNVQRGWHDAGNYDMYVPSTAPTVQALLMAFEARPNLFNDGDLNIPESDNDTPDLLDEVRWGLDWVLSMQEPDTGAFRHREAVMEWTPEGPAHEDRSTRWVAGPSTAATAKAVAALALAARVYRSFDENYAARAEQSARRGWGYLESHPEQVRIDGKGSAQPLWDDGPELTDRGARFVAAVEMWRSFREGKFLEQARAFLTLPEAGPDELVRGAWGNLSRWALAGLALDEETPEDVRGVARQRLLEAAQGILLQVKSRDGYRCASTIKDYYWGHNSNLMEKAHILLVAAALSGDSAFEEAARDQWHWILGRNPNGYSMVTRVGKGPSRMYHLEWGPAEPPPPGYLVGGPNAVEMGMLAPGAPAKALLWDNPEKLRSGVPAHGMWHWHQSDLWDGGFLAEGQWDNGWWAVTEPDIYYNGNLVLVAAHMQESRAARDETERVPREEGEQGAN